MTIVAISDLHGHLPDIPACDVLVIAGDICPDYIGGVFSRDAPEQQAAWVNRVFRSWFEDVPATYEIMTWGNHDWCGLDGAQANFVPGAADSARLQILVDRQTQLLLDDREDGVIVWGTPWSNPFMNWAFMETPEALAVRYSAIPNGIDILISHQPPYGYGDRHVDLTRGRIEHLGSRELLRAIDRVGPKLVICGHIHSGYGRYERNGIPIYNVSIVDEQYRVVHRPTVIDLP